MNRLRYYIQSFRPRTLPLSVSGIILGSSLALREDILEGESFSWIVFGLAILTTLSLQIVTNLSNELGDMLKGTDNENRLGPHGALQSGILTPLTYKRMIVIFTIVSILLGIGLLKVAFGSIFSKESLWLLFSGGLAIVAAITYTLGSKPYGYRGLGDVSVFIFFGLLSTLGSYYLFRPFPDELWMILPPAITAGCFITGVLNVNNIRDYENDATHGKNTLIVKIGPVRGKIYHFLLIIGGWVLMLEYTLVSFGSILDLLYLLSLPLFIWHLREMSRKNGRTLDPQLKVLSLSTLSFCLLAAIGAVMGSLL